MGEDDDIKDDDFDAQLEDAYENKEQSDENTERVHRQKFKPITSNQDEESQPDIKVKYVRGEDGKLKRKVKRKGAVVDTQRERKIPAGSKLLPVNKNTSTGKPTVPEDNDHTRRATDNNSRPHSNKEESSIIPQNVSTDKQDSLKSIEDTNKTTQNDSGSDIFSDAGSDYNPEEYSSDASDTNKNVENKNRNYFKNAIGVQSSLNENQNDQYQSDPITSALNNLRTNKTGKHVPASQDYDGYDIDDFIGGEGKWDEDDDDIDSQPSSKSKRRRKK